MLFRASIRQSLRAPVRLIASFLVVALVCSFLTISINLRQNAQRNIGLLEQEFQVLAIPNFQASVDKYGGLCATSYDSGYAGYLEASAESYDLSILENAPGVTKIETHDSCGAYVQQEEPLYFDPPAVTVDYVEDVIVFTYTGSEAVTVPNIVDSNDPIRINVEIHSSAMGQESRFSNGQMLIENGVDLFQGESMTAAIQRLGLDAMFENDTEDRSVKNGAFTLQPGETYLATGSCWNSVGGQVFTVQMDDTHSKVTTHYWKGSIMTQPLPQAYEGFSDFLPPIVPYGVSLENKEAQDWFFEAEKGCRINAKSLTAIGTNDMAAMLPFHNGDVYISQGRGITKEEYEQGQAVCVVSAFLARINGWQVGDVLNLSLYNTFFGIAPSVNDTRAYYQPYEEVQQDDGTYELEKRDPFFTEGQFEIVGLYEGNVSLSDGASDLQYDRNSGMSRFTVIVPKGAVTGVRQSALNQYNTTILLDGLQLAAFMSTMERSGLMQPQQNGYELGLTIYDNGASAMLQSLKQLDVISRLVLYLACAAADVVVILLSVLTVLQNRRQIASLRSLGVRRRQIPVAILTGILLVCAVGACIGSVAGHGTSEKVTNFILETAYTDLGDTTFTAMLAKTDGQEDGNEALNLVSLPENAVGAAGSVFLLLLLVMTLLTWNETRKSPMLLLGAKE